MRRIRACDGTFETVRRPVVVAHIRALRRSHPNATPAQLVRILERRYLTAITTGGASVGATAMVPGFGTALLARSVGEKKAPLLDANKRAFQRGYDYARTELPPIGLRMQRRDNVGDRIFIDGNSAAALGAVYGGATVCASRLIKNERAAHSVGR